MATLFKASGGTTSIVPGTSWAAPNGLFSTTDRNDGSTYSYSDSTATVTLPSTIDADGYIFIAAYELHDTSNGRCNPQGQWTQASGTGTFTGTPTSGYNRDNSEDRSYVRCWGFVDNPSGSSTYQFQWKRDADTPTGGTERSELWVIPFDYSDWASYTSSDLSMPGGTTPVVVNNFSGTDGTNITISGGNIITLAGDNKRYLVLMSQFFESDLTTRTQRWAGMDIDGSEEHAAKAYSYFRNANNNECGEMYTWLIDRDTTDITIEQTCYLGIGTGNGQGGASLSVDTSPIVADHSIVILELNDSAEVFRSRDNTVSSNLATSPTDLEINTVTDFNDTASFTDAGDDQTINVVQTCDALFGANISAASNNVSTGSRWTAYAEFHVNGTEDTDTFAGDYLRNNQSSNDTFGWSANLMSPIACTAGDDVGVSVTELAGSEGGGNPISPAGWSGMWGINLDTLSEAASTTLTADPGSFTITGTDAQLQLTTPADPGSFVITGTDASLERSLLLDGESGSFVITGTTANLLTNELLDGESGSFVISGTDADLLENYLLAGDSGSFVITGADASLERSLLLSADSGSFVITGTDATLTEDEGCNDAWAGAWDGAWGGAWCGNITITLTADSGTFLITGTDATLLHNEVLDADSGSFVITGTDASLETNEVLSADSGSFVITGADADLRTSEVLDAESGSFLINGTDASLLYNQVLDAESGAFIITGADAEGKTSIVLPADSGAFLVSGTDAQGLYSEILVAESGSFVVTGTNADLLRSLRLSADGGSFVITGTDAILSEDEGCNAAWGTAWGSPSAWGTSWVVTVSDEPIGGHFAWPEKKKKKELIKKVHEEAEQLESAPVEIQKQAEKISKKYPYRITKRNLVKIDTEALQNDLSRLQFLMQAWEEQKIIMQEEEDIIELVTRGLI